MSSSNRLHVKIKHIEVRRPNWEPGFYVSIPPDALERFLNLKRNCNGVWAFKESVPDRAKPFEYYMIWTVQENKWIFVHRY